MGCESSSYKYDTVLYGINVWVITLYCDVQLVPFNSLVLVLLTLRSVWSTHKHVRTHTDRHVCTQTHQTRTHTHTHVRTQTHTCARNQTRMRTHTQTQTNRCTLTRAHSHTHTGIKSGPPVTAKLALPHTEGLRGD